MNEIKFDSAFNFKYSPRRGTKASEYDDQIPEEVKQYRLQRVIDLQRKHTLNNNLNLVGKVEDVLVEKESKMSNNQWAGRTDSNKWIIFDKEDSHIGDMKSIKITKARGISLHGQLTQNLEAA